MIKDFYNDKPKGPSNPPVPKQSPPSTPTRNIPPPKPSGPVYVPGKAVPKVPNPKK